MKKNLTEIVLVIDRSGSMAGLESDTVGGVNALIRRNQQVEGEAVITTILFNHEAAKLHDRVDIQTVAPLSECDYVPSGCTALLDAVGDAIEHIASVQRYLPEEYRPEHTVVAITTDGLENASKRRTYDQVKELIERQTEAGWEFVFLGANIDVAREARRMGIHENNAAPFVSDGYGSELAYEAVADAVCGVREAGCMPTGCFDSVAADAQRRRPEKTGGWPWGRRGKRD